MNADNAKWQITKLKDYQQPDFEIEVCELQVELAEESTVVHTLLTMHRHSSQEKHSKPLVLKGEQLKLISLELNQQRLSPDQYQVTEKELIIPQVPDHFQLQIVTEIYPQKNTALSGLYRSGSMFCTQCEAEGFRRITYYLDRPDVMARFTTTIVADKTRYPVLLSNGNPIDKGELDANKHWIKWEDPFKKPSYLFALVAGPLKCVKDSYQTASGRQVALEVYVEPENVDKCAYALDSLKKAMRWDEVHYGREYDLDIYMIVAVNDFNMGAMENKGLNIFNAKYVLADEKTATDQDFQAVEAVIGHEYFHNWTGNRITCRDWFQLSLKEGLTVFREQQFSADMGSPTVHRIADVRVIRTRQFAEDSGPMAHPVRPESYIEINNFYTMTVYYKGAEVIRMLYTLLGKEKFRKGMDLYFERHDGQAVTIEDFIAAFADANDEDLSQFHHWYHQAGTPEVKGMGEYDSQTKQFKLTLSQHCKETPDSQEKKKPFVIPIQIALYNEQGEKLFLDCQEAAFSSDNGSFVILKESSQTYTFENILSQPIPSLLGNFSAPVKLTYPYNEQDLICLMTHDQDLFNRWDATQRICINAIKTLMDAYQKKKPLIASPLLIEAYKQLLQQKIADPHLLAQLLMVPSFHYVAEELPIIEVHALIAARKVLLSTLAEKCHGDFESVYQSAHQADDGKFSGISMGYRALKNICLSYLMRTEDPHSLMLAQNQYHQARNMTDRVGALSALNLTPQTLRSTLFEDFYQTWKQDPLVVNKWLSLQAASELPDTLENIQALLSHEAFDIGNPNKVYALINTFGASNPECFHHESGAGYHFIADRVLELNSRNPQVAARVVESLTHWKRLDSLHGHLMKEALMKIQSASNLSEDVGEIVSKALV